MPHVGLYNLSFTLMSLVLFFFPQPVEISFWSKVPHKLCAMRNKSPAGQLHSDTMILFRLFLFSRLVKVFHLPRRRKKKFQSYILTL